MSDTKVNLRKIVGLEEEINKLAKQPDRARVLGDKGIHWLNGYGENGEEPTEEEKEEAAKKDKGKNGSRNLDKKKDASEPLQIGDDAGDLGGLKDCKSGQCINVRLHGKAPPPDGWGGVCDPPKDPTFDILYYYKIYFSKTDYKTNTTVNLDKSVRTKNDVINAVYSFFRRDAVEYFGSFVWDTQPWIDKVLSKDLSNLSSSAIVKYPEDTKNSAYYVINTKIRQCRFTPDPVCNITTPPTEQWPQDTCSEVVAGAAGFKGACAAHDPNLPPQFAEAKGEIILCDKDGNEVKFTKTDEGYEVYQAKYRRTAVVDPNTFKVVRFK